MSQTNIERGKKTRYTKPSPHLNEIGNLRLCFLSSMSFRFCYLSRLLRCGIAWTRIYTCIISKSSRRADGKGDWGNEECKYINIIHWLDFFHQMDCVEWQKRANQTDSKSMEKIRNTIKEIITRKKLHKNWIFFFFYELVCVCAYVCVKQIAWILFSSIVFFPQATDKQFFFNSPPLCVCGLYRK